MLHVHNGDATANIAKLTAIPGEHFPWREALIDGPVQNVSDSEWIQTRARHLSDTYGEDFEACKQELVEQKNNLASSANHDEVILWFEHDLFCQTHLLYLLQYFAKHSPQNRLTLICVNSFPGRENFRGLGELTPDELGSLFPSRQEVTPNQFRLAQTAWEAYTSLEPTDIEAVLRSDTSALPYLDDAFRAQLRRFPSTRNGLGAIENRALQLIDEGVMRFDQLFRAFADSEPVYGFGDLQFWTALRRMFEAPQRFLFTGEGANADPRRPILDAEFRLTDLGRAVLHGEADFVLLNGIDMWLGGVHLNGERNMWRWDEANEVLIRS